MGADSLAKSVDIAIIGAGAAGLATAIFAARRLRDASIVALDGARNLGAKILVAGGGRCNVTNRTVTPADFSGGSRHIIGRALKAFGVEATVAFFGQIGVRLHEEEHGKLFPDSSKARTVLAALLGEASRCGARVLPEHRVTALERDGSTFQLTTSAGSLAARRVVLATGGLSLPKTGSDGAGYRLAQRLGHTLVPTTPALVPLVLDGKFHAGLTGVSHEVELSVAAAGRRPVHVRGALLWTHFGVSGPAVLDVSRHWHRARLEQRAVSVSASFLPGSDLAGGEQRLLGLAASQPKASLHRAIARWLPARVATAILNELGIDGRVPLAHVAREVRRRLLRALLAWPLPIRDSRGYGHAEVTAGGVPLDELDAGRMASRRCPGLFLAGEILDVDGRIGGFNFQWAWSSAWVAAAGLADRCGE